MEIMLPPNQKTFSVYVKPASRQSEILGYDSIRQAYKIAVKAPAEDNKANLELMKFLKKQLKKPVKIIKGFKSKEKIIEILD